MKRGHQQGAGGGEGGADGRGGCPPVLKKRCRSLDLEIRGCRHLQELVATCVQAVQVRLETAVESAVARITEDVTKAITSFLSHAPRTHIDQNRPPRYRLTFMNGLDSEVFTKKDIFGTNGELIKICVSVNDPQGVEETELHRRILSANIKIVVLDGDFNKHNQECWTSEEFKNYIVLPRDNIGSVLTGVSELSLKNGEAFLCGVALNDNSKFVRCGKFRLGVMIDDNLGERVLEGITEPFIVKDRRGEGSKKHEIPLLNDDVWRMKKIAKDGVFHKALKSHDINYVQDFLRLYHKDEQALGKILINATKKVWTSIVEHAKKCDPGKELHSFIVQGENTILFFNSVCQIVGAAFGDNYTPFGILDMHKKKLVVEWSKVAYKYMTYHLPDYELDNGKPRPVNNRSPFHELSMLEHKSTDLLQGTNGEENCSDSSSRQCKLKRLGSVRVTHNDEDASFDFSLCLDPIFDQYCASTSENDITGLVTLHCAANMANEITGSVVLTQAPMTMDQQSYNILPFTGSDASVDPLCEDNQPVPDQFGHSLSSIRRSLLDSPIYSRHTSFKDRDCYQAAAAVGAGPTL
ncbi:hypothetical protein QOZ80_5BG0441880 [Eleusine coracana subsp. coracana]|nr:hypothetical protein QOZ80_5BG0441880 [Eleusine coracana subsp. coracana]